jgi:hypothetical protein
MIIFDEIPGFDEVIILIFLSEDVLLKQKKDKKN